MSEPSPRMARVNEVVHEVLADELERMSDPRLELVTITGVEVSPDLKHAKVFYSSLRSDPEMEVETPVTEESGDPVAKALASARRHLQRVLGRQVRLKYVPKLSFVHDPSILEGQKIEEIIREIHRSDD